MSDAGRPSPDRVANQMPPATPAATFEKRSRYRPVTATGTPLKPEDGTFDAEPAQRSSLWIGVGVIAVLVVGGWLILSGVI